jgi:hypothetical protein
VSFRPRAVFHKTDNQTKHKKGTVFFGSLHGAFSLAKIVMISSSSFLPSLVSGASQQFSVFMPAHFFLALLHNASHSITSIF